MVLEGVWLALDVHDQHGRSVHVDGFHLAWLELLELARLDEYRAPQGRPGRRAVSRRRRFRGLGVAGGLEALDLKELRAATVAAGFLRGLAVLWRMCHYLFEVVVM